MKSQCFSMFDKAAIKLSFSKAAGHYEQHAILQEEVRKGLAALIKPLIMPQDWLLDVGAGTGALAVEVEQVISVDYAFGMCVQARKQTGRVVNAQAEMLPFQDKSVNLVASNLMLQWLAEPQIFLEECARVLTPGGYLCITTFSKDTLTELSEAFSRVDEYAHISQFQSMAALENAAMKAGFEIVSIKYS